MPPKRRNAAAALAKTAEKMLATLSRASRTPMKAKSKTETVKKPAKDLDLPKTNRKVKNDPGPGTSATVEVPAEPLQNNPDSFEIKNLPGGSNATTSTGYENREDQASSNTKVMSKRQIGKKKSRTAVLSSVYDLPERNTEDELNSNSTKETTRNAKESFFSPLCMEPTVVETSLCSTMVTKNTLNANGDETTGKKDEDESYQLAENDAFWIVESGEDQEMSFRSVSDEVNINALSASPTDTDKYAPLRDVALEDLLEPDAEASGDAGTGREKMHIVDFDSEEYKAGVQMEIVGEFPSSGVSLGAAVSLEEYKMGDQMEIVGDFPLSGSSLGAAVDLTITTGEFPSSGSSLSLGAVDLNITGEFPSIYGSFGEVDLNISGEFPCSGTTEEEERRLIEELEIMNSFTESDM